MKRVNYDIVRGRLARGEFETFLTLNKTKGWNVMRKFSTKELTLGGMIAALYVVLTYVARLLGLDSYAIQVRFSEALTILPVFTVAAVPGLTMGCFLANMLFGLGPWDVVFGSIATLLAALATRALKKKPGIAWIPPVISNMLIVPIVLLIYHFADVTITVPFTGATINASGYVPCMITVAIGEIISCGILGLLLWRSLKNVPIMKELQ